MPSSDLMLAAASDVGDMQIHEGEDRWSAEVDLSTAISPHKVRGLLEGGDPAFLITRSGVRSTVPDPWPDLERRVSEKARQLAGASCGVIGVEAAHAHVSTYGWADRVRSGYAGPKLTTADNIAGLIVFWMDLRRGHPWRSIFVANSRWLRSQPSVLRQTLQCLGVT
jgi:hypothetical protein